MIGPLCCVTCPFALMNAHEKQIERLHLYDEGKDRNLEDRAGYLRLGA